MDSISKWLIVVFSFLLSTSTIAQEEASPTGYWKTIDDISGKPKAIVEVSFDNKHMLQGRIVKVFHESLKEQHTICTACVGEKKDKPLVGLIIMEQLKQSAQDKNHWESGSILDPKTGKIYRCHIDFDNEHQQMKVRGFLGFALLGRTQVWERIKEKIVP